MFRQNPWSIPGSFLQHDVHLGLCDTSRGQVPPRGRRERCVKSVAREISITTMMNKHMLLILMMLTQSWTSYINFLIIYKSFLDRPIFFWWDATLGPQTGDICNDKPHKPARLGRGGSAFGCVTYHKGRSMCVCVCVYVYIITHRYLYIYIYMYMYKRVWNVSNLTMRCFDDKHHIPRSYGCWILSHPPMTYGPFLYQDLKGNLAENHRCKLCRSVCKVVLATSP